MMKHILKISRLYNPVYITGILFTISVQVTDIVHCSKAQWELVVLLHLFTFLNTKPFGLVLYC